MRERVLAVIDDVQHSGSEPRFRVLSRTTAGRPILVVVTYRERSGITLLRPISARYVHAKELASYAAQNAPSPFEE